MTACVANVVVDVKALWPLDENADAPRRDVAHPFNDNGAEPIIKRGVSPWVSFWGSPKRTIKSPKLWGSINKSEPRKYQPNTDGKWTNPMDVVNPNPMGVNRLIVPSCETYEKTFMDLNQG